MSRPVVMSEHAFREISDEREQLERTLTAANDRIGQLLRRIETLEWALDCAGIIARAGLDVAAGVAMDPEPVTCPPANPLNVP